MTLLFSIADDLLRLMTIVDMGAGAIILAMAFRERILMASYAPEWHGWFTLRRPIVSQHSVPTTLTSTDPFNTWRPF